MKYRVWQIAAGDSGRHYDDIFLRHDVVFLGPGRFGSYCRAEYEDGPAARAASRNVLGQVRSFAEAVRPGDLVLLRKGYKVVSIGVADGSGYQHNDVFDDVYGWDLEHTRRVKWQRQHDQELADIQSSAVLFSERRQIPTFTRVEDPLILPRIEHLFSRTEDRPLALMPDALPRSLTPDELGVELFRKGLPAGAIERVKSTIAERRRLIHWYSQGLSPNRPTEHEVVAHVILPLLLALGWSEQLLAIEWRRIDLAIFNRTPTSESNCRLICEAKAMGHGLQDCREQAESYVENLDLKNCGKILLADGGRFYLYKRQASKWSAKPSGYLNISKIRTQHLCPSGTSAIDTIMELTPAHIVD
jgi:hypothetical protein